MLTLRHAAWRSLESMLSERSQAQKATCCAISFMRNKQKRHVHRDRKIRDCLGFEGMLGVDEGVLRLNVMVAELCKEVAYRPLNYALSMGECEFCLPPPRKTSFEPILTSCLRENSIKFSRDVISCSFTNR